MTVLSTSKSASPKQPLTTTMKNKDITILVQDKHGCETFLRDYESKKDALTWVKECGLSADYWARLAEVSDFALLNVHTIRLNVGGECVKDWFPTFTESRFHKKVSK